VLRIGRLVLDRESHQVTLSGEGIDLTPTEFNLLEILMENPGRAFSRAELLESIQGIAFEAYERTVDAHVKNLRRKIQIDPADSQWILTVRGVGYRLNPEIENA
jgi:DNA-binding response OmpR family regulator